MKLKIDGCVHLIIKEGNVVNTVLHLSNLPKDGVIHLKADGVYSFEEFAKTHPKDIGEIKKKQ